MLMYLSILSPLHWMCAGPSVWPVRDTDHTGDHRKRRLSPLCTWAIGRHTGAGVLKVFMLFI